MSTTMILITIRLRSISIWSSELLTTKSLIAFRSSFHRTQPSDVCGAGTMSWTIIPGTNDLPKIVISHRSGSSAQIYLNGAQVTSWKTSDDVERLFLSPAARFENGKPIRGGIPVVFPQFADS